MVPPRGVQPPEPTLINKWRVAYGSLKVRIDELVALVLEWVTELPCKASQTCLFYGVTEPFHIILCSAPNVLDHS